MQKNWKIYFIINGKFYFISVFFNPLAAKKIYIYFTLQKVVSQNWYTAHSKGLQMKSARIKLEIKNVIIIIGI